MLREGMGADAAPWRKRAPTRDLIKSELFEYAKYVEVTKESRPNGATSSRTRIRPAGADGSGADGPPEVLREVMGGEGVWGI